MLVKEENKLGRSRQTYTHVRVHRSTHEALKQLAAEENASIQNVISSLIEFYQSSQIRESREVA